MKKLLGSLAVIIALGSAAPALASDVTGDRYSPGRTTQAPNAQRESSREAEPAKPPCACPCLKSAGETASRTVDGR